MVTYPYIVVPPLPEKRVSSDPKVRSAIFSSSILVAKYNYLIFFFFFFIMLPKPMGNRESDPYERLHTSS